MENQVWSVALIIAIYGFPPNPRKERPVSRLQYNHPAIISESWSLPASVEQYSCPLRSGGHAGSHQCSELVGLHWRMLFGQFILLGGELTEDTVGYFPRMSGITTQHESLEEDHVF